MTTTQITPEVLSTLARVFRGAKMGRVNQSKPPKVEGNILHAFYGLPITELEREKFIERLGTHWFVPGPALRTWDTQSATEET